MNNIGSISPSSSAAEWPASSVHPDWGDMFVQASQPSLLILSASSDSADYITQIGTAADFRVLGTSMLADGVAHLNKLVDVDAIFVSCRGDEPCLEGLLARLDVMAGNNDVILCVVVELPGLDRLHSLINASRAFVLCEPQVSDISATLIAMRNLAKNMDRLNDSGRGEGSEKLDKISDDLERLTRTIEALVQNRTPGLLSPMSHTDPVSSTMHSPERRYSSGPEGMSAKGSRNAALEPQQIRSILRARRLREQIFGADDLFADPAWDIMLDLMAAHLENTKVSVSSLCIAAAVPPTTALRWIRQLTDKGLLVRQADPSDGRRIFIALSDQGAEAVTRWFAESRALLLDAAR